MAEIAPMLSVLGYDPYANPPDYGKPDAVVANNTRYIQREKEVWDKKAKEMFNVRWDNSDADAGLDREPSDTTNITWYEFVFMQKRVLCYVGIKCCGGSTKNVDNRTRDDDLVSEYREDFKSIRCKSYW